MCGSILINVRSATDRIIGVRLRIRCVQRHTYVCMGSQTQVTYLRLFCVRMRWSFCSPNGTLSWYGCGVWTLLAFHILRRFR